MYRYLNVNPSNRTTDDCLIRAIAIIFGISWEKAYTDLCNYGLLIHDMPNKDSTLSLYLRERGFKRYVMPDCPACYTIREFAEEHPYGDYILLTSGHAVPLINGTYYDTTDSGDEILTYYWKEEKDGDNLQ